ncbi:MAG: divalent metal cation transporter [Candidatus Sulfotelmatobacter sp.]
MATAIAVPVLAASAAYGIGEGCQWRVSLKRRPHQAVGFYSVIGIAIAAGFSLNCLHIDPVKALYRSAILNGLVAAPLMAVIMMMASPRKVMGKFVIPVYLRWAGWFIKPFQLGEQRRGTKPSLIWASSAPAAVSSTTRWPVI